MIECFRDVIAADEIEVFRQFLYRKDQYVDDRGDVYNKLMTLEQTDWPYQLLQDILDRVMPVPYDIENADFQRTRFRSRLHCDTGDGDQQRLYRNVIIPLEVPDSGSTAIFPNLWFGPAARFTKTDISPFLYAIADVNGQEQQVPDIRLLLSDMESQQEPVINHQGWQFNNSEQDRDWLRDLVGKREKAEPRITDYSGITDVTDEPFPEEFRQQWLAHIPAETLHGLGVPEIVEWRVGDVITFDRQHLHSGTSRLEDFKSFIGVFTWQKKKAEWTY